MVLIIFLLPCLFVLLTALILGNSGRTLKEKFTIFIYSPDDIDNDSSVPIAVLRWCFWISVILSTWIIIGIIMNRG